MVTIAEFIIAAAIIFFVIRFVFRLIRRLLFGSPEKSSLLLVQAPEKKPKAVLLNDPDPDPDPEPVSPPAPKEFSCQASFPETMQEDGIAYSYNDVDIIPVEHGHYFPKQSLPLSFFCRDQVEVWAGSHLIGFMRDNRLAGMVRDWISAGKYLLAFCVRYAENDTYAQIAIAFYDNLIEKFIRTHPDGKQFRLTGRPEDDADVEASGQACSVDFDFEKERYEVSVGPFVIGFLPAGAVSYAEEHDLSPEDLSVILIRREDDDDKTKYTVFVSE